MKLTDLINEEKYTIIDPKGNPAGTGTKDQANQRQKKLGGSKKGYFVVPAKKALKARRTLEKYKFDFKNTKLQDLMSDLYFESVNENAYKNWLKRNNMKDNRDNQSLYHYLLKKHKSVSNFPKHYESVNEGASTEEKRIVMMAVKKIAKYRNVSLDYAVGDVMRAAQELERDIQKGKVK